MSIISKISGRIKKIPPKQRTLWGLALALLLSFTFSLAFFSLPIAEAFEWKVVDTWVHRTGDTQESQDIMVVGIDEPFFKSSTWPISKETYAEILMYLGEMGAKVIGVDIMFDKNLNACDEGDVLFKQVLQILDNVILIYSPTRWAEKPEDDTLVIPMRYALGKGEVPGSSIIDVNLPYEEILELNPMIAHHNVERPYADGLARRLPLMQSSGGYLFPSLSLISASLYLDTAEIKWDKVKGEMLVGGSHIPIDEKTNNFINYKHKIPFYGLLDLYKSMKVSYSGGEPEIGREQIEGRIVLIGASAPLLGDNTITPMSYKYHSGDSPKVLLHAKNTATILTNSGIRYYGRGSAIIFSFLVLIIVLILFKTLQVRTAYILVMLLAASSYFIGGKLYDIGYLMPIVEGLSAGVLFAFMASLVIFFEKDMDRSFLFDSFKTYLSESLIEDMYKNKIMPQLGGVEGIRTAFFTDIQSFSTFSEKIGSPTKLVELLNEYLSAMTDILLECQGTLDKYEGDAIIAFFGAPLEMADHAEKSCLAALRMQMKLGELRNKWKSEGDKWPEIVHAMRMRIGINTGSLVTGNMGSHVRMNYTMMGDAVNLAARLESGAKQYGVFTLVSEDTIKSVGPGKFLSRQIDTIRVVGKSEPVKIFELLCTTDIVPEDMRKCADTFARARQHYIKQEWDEAKALFEECLTYEPFHPDRSPGCKTTPSGVYIKRCKAFKEAPPVPEGQVWDGVYTATEK